MSFFKKLTEEFKDLKTSFESKNENKHAESHSSAEPGPSYYNHDHSHRGEDVGSYGPSGMGGYGQPEAYASSPAQYYGSPGGPQLPPGWISHFDPSTQRYYYVEQATGKTTWEPPPGYGLPVAHSTSTGGHGAAGSFYDHEHPGHIPPSQYNHTYPSGHYPDGTSRGYYHDGLQAYGHHHHDAHGSHQHEMYHEKEKSNTGKYLLAGAGGLAVGGLAVAALSGDDSDEEQHYAVAPPPDPYMAEAAPPPEIDESDHESIEEAREEYEEAAAEAADSDASSSEQEELQEAQEEYEEEVEEAYED